MAMSESVNILLLSANEYLERIKRGDSEWLIAHFNSENKHIHHSCERMMTEFEMPFRERIAAASVLLKEVNSVSELREVYVDHASDIFVVVAKLLSAGDHVFVLTLTRQNERFFFDHMNFTEKRIYEKWRVLWKDAADS